MGIIAIETKRELFFGQNKSGFIRMNIDLIINNPSREEYTLKIVDSCLKKEVLSHPMENDAGVIQMQEETIERELIKTERYVTYTYDDVKKLAGYLKLDKSKFSSEVEYINELFRQGLLAITLQECKDGISGKGKGMYQSEIKDWALVD